MEKVAGYIDNFIFQNEENGYCVLTLVTEDGELTCVGVLHGVTAGMNVAFTGSYTEHPSYGRQFKVQSYEEKEPEEFTEIYDIQCLNDGQEASWMSYC